MRVAELEAEAGAAGVTLFGFGAMADALCDAIKDAMEGAK